LAADGLRVGDPLDAFQGILTGTPSFLETPGERAGEGE
jgi:hypothetical protein